jgi:hypothetical protein
MSHAFVCRQLLCLVAKVCDLYDEAGRVALSSLLRSLVPDAADVPEVVAPAIDNLKRLNPDEDSWAQLVVEIVSDMRDPIDIDAESQSRGDEEAAVRMPAEKEAAIWRGCLNVVRRFLETTRKDLKNPLIAGLLYSIILPTVTHADTSVREKAVGVLGLYCLLGLHAAKEYLFLFLKVLEHDIVAIKAVALKVLLDVILAHGTTALEITDMLTLEMMARDWSEEEEARQRALVSIVNCLNDRELRGIAAEGLAKCFYVGTLGCPQTFARLVALYFDPGIAEDAPYLHSCLSAFFPSYIFSRRFHGRHQAVAEKSFLSAIQWAQSCNIVASRSGPSDNRKQISVLAVAEFVLRLTGEPPEAVRQKIARQHDTDCHARIATELVKFLLAHPKQLPGFVDVLPLFELDICSAESLSELSDLAEAIKVEKDRTIAKKVVAFVEHVLKAREQKLPKPQTPMVADISAETSRE